MSTAVHPAPVPFAPTESQLAVAYSVCRSITRSQAKNFYYGFLVLPRAKRQALCAVYAFMRRCDDIADDAALAPGERRRRLDEWLQAFHRAHAGYPTDDPVLLALTDAQRRFQIRVGLLDQLGYGTGMDLGASDGEEGGSEVAIRYRSFEELRVYCYRVASVVGLVCIAIFGYHDPQAEPLAEECGLAFQITNIIRDVKEDAAMGRVYLPEEDLARFGISAAELRTASDAARYRPLLELEAERAREGYRAGERLLNFVDEDSRPALWVLMTTYRRLLEKMAQRRFDVFHGRISLGAGEKLAILARGLLQRLA